MGMAGLFHDAHEVYIQNPEAQWGWVATFATKGLADWYVKAATREFAAVAGMLPIYEVRPV